MNIEELLQAFDQCAKESQDQLTEMLSTISEGRVPSRTDISQFELVIANLRVKYDCVYQAAADQLPSDELPPDNAPASAFVEALKNSETLRIKQQLAQAKNILQRFISVRSLIAAYSDALRPFQQEAAALLGSLDENKVQTNAVTDALAGPQVLLAALDFPDKETEEGLAICDQITDYYPKRVYAGIVADKYFFDENTPDRAIPPEASPSRQPEENTVESAPIPDSEPEPVQEEITSCVGADSCAEQRYADVIAKLHEKACFLTQNESDAAVESETSPNETKKSLPLSSGMRSASAYPPEGKCSPKTGRSS